MNGLKNYSDFDKEMSVVLAIMEDKGFIVESDHPYAYSMQYAEAFNDVSEWLKENGYNGNLDREGYYAQGSGAVYGLFDKDRVSYEEMHKELIKEAKKQGNWR